MKSIIEVKADVYALAIAEGGTWAESILSAITAALAQPSPVDTVVGAYRELAAIAEPSDLARWVLRGCAEQIVAGQFHGLTGEAAEVFAGLAAVTDPRVAADPPAP